MKTLVWCLNVDICVVSLSRAIWKVWIFVIIYNL